MHARTHRNIYMSISVLPAGICGTLVSFHSQKTCGLSQPFNYFKLTIVVNVRVNGCFSLCLRWIGALYEVG